MMSTAHWFRNTYWSWKHTTLSSASPNKHHTVATSEMCTFEMLFDQHRVCACVCVFVCVCVCLTSVCTIRGRCMRRSWMVPYTSTMLSLSIWKRRRSMAIKVPVRPTPALWRTRRREGTERERSNERERT